MMKKNRVSDKSLVFLTKENDLNKILRNQKRDRHPMSILFVSLWDKWCVNLVDSLKEAYGDVEDGDPLYVVDSFYMPHSFVIFNSVKLPHLVTIKEEKVYTVDYLPKVYTTLGI